MAISPCVEDIESSPHTGRSPWPGRHEGRYPRDEAVQDLFCPVSWQANKWSNCTNTKHSLNLTTQKYVTRWNDWGRSE